ncbi:MAG: uracil-DNA glycosylase [Ureaplasma sp.]|nr:uracil-DNA glycosylase [Ureaplasma sp.]MDE7222131.1 uracil-DNA glycosylase [Ureaplasma sp.]
MINNSITFLNQYKLDEWKEFIDNQINYDYFINLINKVSECYKLDMLFPKQSDLFKALELVSLKNLKVIIIGQDPYFNDNQANGLAFSVNKQIEMPPSLKNIFKEIKNEFGEIKTDSDLISWCNQGVLLLNTILTVKKYQTMSCSKWGWEKFTYNLISYILKKKDNIVVICLGKYAQSFVKELNNNKHCFLSTSHPSPLSVHCGFLGSNIFKKVNKYLLEKNKEKIIW